MMEIEVQDKVSMNRIICSSHFTLRAPFPPDAFGQTLSQLCGERGKIAYWWHSMRHT